MDKNKNQNRPITSDVRESSGRSSRGPATPTPKSSSFGTTEKSQAVTIGLLTIALIIGAALLWFQPRASVNFFPAPAAVSSSSVGVCRTLVESCQAELILRPDVCNPDEARALVSSKFDNILEHGDCPKTLKRLEQACPEGCRVDFSTMSLVQGTLDFAYKDADQEKNYCRARLRRPVTIRVMCIGK